MNNIKAWKYIFGYLILIVALIWGAVFSRPENNLIIVACDVGQGDAILISDGSSQILIDGGNNNKVVECLSRYMAFWDREIEMVVITHPQADHITGLIEVFERYDVKSVLATPVENSSQGYQLLKNNIGVEASDILVANKGLRLRLGVMYLDIVHPDIPIAMFADGGGPDVLGAYETKRDLNDYSVVFNLRYGEFDALFTGDIGPDVVDEIVNDGELNDVEYLKVPHHGSKNGLTGALLSATTPEFAVISAGKNNQFGHPHKEVLDILKDAGIKTERTDLEGDIVLETDGEKWWVR